MAIRRAYFDRLLLEEGESEENKERKRVEALWDEAEQHAERKGGDFSLAWQQVPSVSEKHIFGFHERHGGTRVRVWIIRCRPTPFLSLFRRTVTFDTKSLFCFKERGFHALVRVNMRLEGRDKREVLGCSRDIVELEKQSFISPGLTIPTTNRWFERSRSQC